jgi:GxxExxY protein
METDGTGGREIAAPMVCEGEDLTQRIIGCAIEVHRHLGPGLLESAYEGAMCVELSSAGIPYECQVPLPVVYKGQVVGEYRIDLIVDRAVVVELKSVERFDPVFEAQVLTYLRVTGKDWPVDQLQFASPEGWREEVCPLILCVSVPLWLISEDVDA